MFSYYGLECTEYRLRRYWK